MKWSSRWIYSGRNSRFDQSVQTLSSVLKFVFFISNLLIINVTFNQPTVCFLPVQMMALFCFLYMVYCRVQLSGDKHSAPSSLSVFHSFLRVMNRAWSIWAGSASSKICQNELKRHRHSTTRGRWGKRQRSVSMCGKSTYRWGSNPHTEHRRLFCTSVETGVNVVLSVFSKQFSGGIGRSEAVPEDPDLR